MLFQLLRKPVLFILCLMAGVVPAEAMIVESGNTIVIDSVTHEDIYLIAGTVTINAPVHGDLIVAGGKIYINDTVNNVLLAGGTVVVNGFIAGKIRCLGGTLVIARGIQGDLAAAGGDITIERNAAVMGDVLVSGGSLTVYGNVGGDIRAATGKFRLFGTVGRGLVCRGGRIELNGKVMGASELSVSKDLIIGSHAALNGPVRYWAPSAVDFGASLNGGQAIFDKSLVMTESRWYFLGLGGLLAVLWYLAAALLVIILLQYLFPNVFRKAGEMLYDHSLRSFGTGILFFLGTPVVIVLSFISLVAIPVGLALLLGYVFVLLICGCITAVVASNWVCYVMGSSARFWEQVWISMGFFVLLRLIFSFPILAWILFPVLACIAIGALFTGFRWKREKLRQV